MVREGWWGLAGIVLLLLVGLFIGRSLAASPNVSRVSSEAADAFRAYLWERRSLDLLVQVALIFVGALGVAAVLPKHDESRSATLPDESVPIPSQGSSRIELNDDSALD